MPQNRDLKLDLVALGLFVVVVFLAAALATHDAADPVEDLLGPLAGVYQPDLAVYPRHDEAHNACGRWGAIAADLLFSALGLGAYGVVASLATLDYLLLRRRPLDQPILRTAGWFLALVGAAVLAALLLPEWSPAAPVGAGGYVGALGQCLLERHFAAAGSAILAASGVAAGTLLCTDYLLFQWTWRALALGVAGARRLATRARAARPSAASAADALASGRSPADGKAGKKAGAAASSPAPRDASAAGEPFLVREPLHAGEPVGGRKQRHDLESPALAGAHASKKPAGKALASPAPLAGGLASAGEASTGENAAARHGAVPSAAPARAGASDELQADGAADDNLVVKSRAASREADADREDAAEHDEKEDDSPRCKVRKRQKTEREAMMRELDRGAKAGANVAYPLPDVELLQPGDPVSFENTEHEVRAKAKVLERTFAEFGFQVKVVEIETGPVISQYEIQLEAGLRLSKITSLADDLAIALRAPSVRIVAPIPGKNTVGIEVPNDTRQFVRLREVIEETSASLKKNRIPIFLGKDVAGSPLVVDLSTLPHLLIAGRTGTGKSVCLNAIIASILMTRRPDEVRMLMIDPKQVELSGYGRLPHLMHPVVTDMRKAEAILGWAVEKMEERYSLLARAGVRHISNYNQLGEAELLKRLQPENDEERESIPRQLPFIVVVADEIADLMMQCGKEVEQHIIRLAQKSRAVGIHLILATQKPTVDVITGLIKSNLPARIAFQVASRTDSRVVLDEMGADKLLGNGDMLFLCPGATTLLRGQGTYLGDEEIQRVTDYVSGQAEPEFVEELVKMKPKRDENAPAGLPHRDDLYEGAVEVIIREGRGSVSLLQRALGIGYGRAARLIDYMAEDGVVGGYAGSQAREVLVTLEQWEEMKAGGAEAEPPAAPKPTLVLPRALETKAAEVKAPETKASEVKHAGKKASRGKLGERAPDEADPAERKPTGRTKADRKLDLHTPGEPPAPPRGPKPRALTPPWEDDTDAIEDEIEELEAWRDDDEVDELEDDDRDDIHDEDENPTEAGDAAEDEDADERASRRALFADEDDERFRYDEAESA